MTGPYLCRLRLPTVDVAVATTTPESHALVAADWSRCRIDRPGQALPQADLLAADSVTILSPELRYRLVARLVDQVVEHACPDQLLFHAAGVCDGEGQVIGLVGSSGAGKTTAARHLCSPEFGYVTDELLLVGPGGSVVPFPKPLCEVRDPDDPVKQVTGPDKAGLTPHAPGPLRLAAIALLCRDADGTATVDRPTAAAALWLLSRELIGLQSWDRPLTILAGLLAQVPLVAVHYREAASLEPVVRRLLTTPGPAAGAYHPVDPDSPQPLGPGYRRCDWQDAVVAGDEVLVVRDGVVRHLGPLATAVWLAADGIDPAALDLVITARFGPPPQGLSVAAIADGLVAAGLLAPPAG